MTILVTTVMASYHAMWDKFTKKNHIARQYKVADDIVPDDGYFRLQNIPYVEDHSDYT